MLTFTITSHLPNTEKQPKGVINPGRHAAECRICAHPLLDEIEQDFINWRSPASIAKQYNLRNRASVYRHAHALELFPKRRSNLRAALEKILERAGEVKVNAPAVVSAVTAFARLNSKGELIERTETVNMNSLFERMSVEELNFCRCGACSPACPCRDTACQADLSEVTAGKSCYWQ